MPRAQSEFADTYSTLPDEEIASLFADIGSLTAEAQSALRSEIERRGLNEAQLNRVHAVELRHEAQFDRLESFRRKKLAWGRLPNSPREWILAIVIFIVMILISDMVSSHH